MLLSYFTPLMPLRALLAYGACLLPRLRRYFILPPLDAPRFDYADAIVVADAACVFRDIAASALHKRASR